MTEREKYMSLALALAQETAATGEVPVIFCVLTTDNEQQALDRAGGVLCNKGTEAAEAAIKMAAFKHGFAQS